METMTNIFTEKEVSDRVAFSYVELTFNTRTGELNNIEPDNAKTPRFKASEFWEGWLTNTTKERVKEVLNLLE